MNTKKILCALLAGVLLFAAGCGAGATSGSSAPSAPAETREPKTELMVSAAASLTDCMGELKTLFTAAHPNITVTYNFGSSGALQQQIEQGAPADVFFSAGKKQMIALQEAGLMDDGSVKDILENKVVLITPKGGAELMGFEQLAEASVEKIAAGEPESVPVGQYTREIFEALTLTEAVKPKLVYAKDVREVLAWVETGNADAGIVYETDAKISDKVEIRCAAPTGSHKKVIYPVGVTKGTKQAAGAQAFVDFLFTDAAKAVFVKYGFSTMF